MRRNGTVLVIGLSLLTACTPPQHEEPTGQTASLPSASTAANPSSDIEVAYERFWDIGNSVISQDPASWNSQLAAVATDPQLTRMLDNLKTLRARSLTVYGTTREHLTKVDIDGTTATVLDCQDASESGQADARSGAHKTVGIPRNPVSARMRRDANGTWKVAEISYPGGTC
ncbi:hypothetical protein [Kutzneria sp. NPDC052558]|uniref:hypothetical protein n=1 Tax=Kutzneria sp. NPDC052558 TaxID=3364121 RepID=UPI0037C5EAB4